RIVSRCVTCAADVPETALRISSADSAARAAGWPLSAMTSGSGVTGALDMPAHRIFPGRVTNSRDWWLARSPYARQTRGSTAAHELLDTLTWLKPLRRTRAAAAASRLS